MEINLLTQELTQNFKYDDLVKDVKVPFLIEDKTLLSEGTWNGAFYSEEEIEKAIKNTDWNDKTIRSIFLDHIDGTDPDNKGGAGDWVGEVLNVQYIKGRGAVGDLVIVDTETARKLAYGAKFGISAKVDGLLEGEENPHVIDFTFLNDSIVINPACKRAWINNAQKVSKMDKEEKKLELADLVAKLEEISKTFVETNERLSKIEKKLDEEPEPKAPVEEAKSEETPKEEVVEEKAEPVAEEKPAEKVTAESETSEEVKEEEAKKEEARENELNELKRKVEELNERLNEPETLIEKGETKTETLEEKIKNASDEKINEAMIELMIKSQGTMNLKK